MDVTKDQSLNEFYLSQLPQSKITGLSHTVYCDAGVIAAIVSIASIVSSVGTSAYQTSEQSKASSKSRKTARALESGRQQFWLEHAFRSPEAIESARKQGAANIETSRAAGMERLSQALGPSRGWGRGSGILGAVGKGLEMGAIGKRGELESQLTELATTPMWPYGASESLASAATATSGGAGSTASDISKSFSTAAGYINTLYGSNDIVDWNALSSPTRYNYSWNW